MRTIAVEKATKGGPAVLIGRPSDSRVAWETARAADAADLNQLLAAGGTVEAYVVPLWSNADAERCLRDLRGFDDARVYVVPAPGADGDAVFAAVAEADWVGVSSPPFAPARGGGGGWREEAVASLIHAAASLDLPLLLPDLDAELALNALARAIADDLTPREIEAVLRGERRGETDPDALDHARELLGDP